MTGDNYTSPSQCEFADVLMGVEADSGPYYCDFTEEEAHQDRTIKSVFGFFN